MFPSFGLAFDALVFAVGVIWWQQLSRRFGVDLRTFRETQEDTEKAAIAILWGVSAAWALWMAGLLIGAVRVILTLGG